MSATRNTETDKAEPTKKRVPTPRPDEMTPDVVEFIQAIDEYKRIHQRPFPTWSEVLDIIKDLGYLKPSA